MNVPRLVQSFKSNRVLRFMLYPLILVRRFALVRRTRLQNEILDNLKVVLCEDPIVRVSEFPGRFAIDPRSDLFRRIIRSQKYEPELVQICRQYVDRNRDVIDIGANVGFYSVLFAKELAGRRVLAIEPTPNALKRLRRNLIMNEVADRVVVFEGVASNRMGEATIHTVAGKEEYSSLGVIRHPMVAAEAASTIAVSSSPIDQLIKENSFDPGFVKIDVEGMEHVVFQGMTEVLSRCRPVILSELSNFILRQNGSSSLEVIQFIKKFDYDVLDPTSLGAVTADRDFGDILCLPRRR